MEDMKPEPKIGDLSPEQLRNLKQYVRMQQLMGETMHDFIKENRDEIVRRVAARLKAEGIQHEPNF